MSSAPNRPVDTPFKQQRLPAWQPILSPPWVIGCFIVVALLFILIGALIIVASGNVNEVEVRYDDKDAQRYCPFTANPKCYASDGAGRTIERWFQVEIPARMEKPVYLYYKLDGFYQNHRRYAKSRNDNQLSGSKVTITNMDDCKPFRFIGDVQNENKPADTDFRKLYSPCGLIAWSMFNDSIKVWKSSTGADCSKNRGACQIICDGEFIKSPATKNMQCTKDGIAWTSDREKKFKAPFKDDSTEYYHSTSSNIRYYNGEGNGTRFENRTNDLTLVEGHLLPVQTDEDFMVWMRTAALPTFRKLYRIFQDTTFEQGDKLWIQVVDRFDVKAFDGKKSIILATTSWIGGKNYFLGTAYCAVGGLCCLFGLGFLVRYMATRGRK